MLEPGLRTEYIYRRDSGGYPKHWDARIFLPAYDLFFPIRVDRNLQPGRVHVRLRPAVGE